MVRRRERCVIEDTLRASQQVLKSSLRSNSAATCREDRVLCLFNLLAQLRILTGHHKTRLILYRLANLDLASIVANLTVCV